MKLRLFGIEILNEEETILSFSSVIKTSDLKNWKSVLGEEVNGDFSNE